MSASSSAAASDPWVILHTVPLVYALHHDHDLSYELADPPRVSFLTVSTRVSAARPNRLKPWRTSSVIRSPRILSADLSAGLFLIFTPTASRTSAATDVCCFVLHAASWTSRCVPAPFHAGAPGIRSFGVIAARDGASFMVVGLRSVISDNRASLYCFSSQTGRWFIKDVNSPHPHPVRDWTFSGVIAHDGKLWWVDTTSSPSPTTKGLFYCDPFAHQPILFFVPFPNDAAALEARAEATAYDHVQVADGKIRWVHVLCDLDEAPVLNGAPLLSIYSVLGEYGYGYRLEFEAPQPRYWGDAFSFRFILESDTFKETEMPKVGHHPVLALIDPNDTALLYFLLGDYLFGFDIRKHEMLGYARHGMAADPDASSSSSLLAWKLPPVLAAPEARRILNKPMVVRIKEESLRAAGRGRGLI